MKFVRQFLAVTLLVAAVVGVGLIWRDSGAAGIVADNRGGGRGFDERRPPSGAPNPGERERPGQRERRGAGGLSLSSIDDLVQTVVVLSLFVGGVVVIDKWRRRRNPIVTRPASGAGD